MMIVPAGVKVHLALGYTDMIEVALGQLPMDEAITRIKADTRRFIRMQDAWFRPYWK